MTLADLIAAFRTEADDQTPPYLWSDADIVGYLNDAENEACIRANLLVAEKTLRFTPSRRSVALDPLVLDIIEARLDTRPNDNRLLERQSIGWMDAHDRLDNGIPTSYAIVGQSVYLHPTPTITETLRIRFYRLPSEALSLTRPTSEPEIPLSEHVRLLDWALYRAFSKRDADSYEGKKAVDYAAQFAEHFGPRPSAHARQQYREAAEHRVKCISF